MTEEELKALVTEIAAEHIEKQAIEGLFPNVSEGEAQTAFELMADGYYENIISNPHLRAKLSTATTEEVETYIRTFVAEADRMTREKMGLPYQE